MWKKSVNMLALDKDQKLSMVTSLLDLQLRGQRSSLNKISYDSCNTRLCSDIDPRKNGSDLSPDLVQNYADLR